MRRVARWLLNALIALSLLLSVATATLWVRSYWVDDMIEVKIADPAHWRIELSYARSAGGLVTLERGFQQFNGPGYVRGAAGTYRVTHWTTTPDVNNWGIAQGSFWHRRGFAGGTYGLPWHGYVLLPYWFVLIVVSSPAWSAAFHRIRRSRRLRQRLARGACASCGYSLVGNRSGVCPECGTPVASSPPAPEGRKNLAPGVSQGEAAAAHDAPAPR